MAKWQKCSEGVNTFARHCVCFSKVVPKYKYSKNILWCFHTALISHMSFFFLNSVVWVQKVCVHCMHTEQKKKNHMASLYASLCSFLHWGAAMDNKQVSQVGFYSFSRLVSSEKKCISSFLPDSFHWLFPWTYLCYGHGRSGCFKWLCQYQRRKSGGCMRGPTLHKVFNSLSYSFGNAFLFFLVCSGI